MAYIIDGNNLLGQVDPAGIRDPASREVFLRRLLAFQRSTRTRIILIFDGHPEGEPARTDLTEKFSIHYPEAGEDADAVIQNMIEARTDKRRLVLVSSDRVLRDFARARSVKSLTSQEFDKDLRRILRQRRKDNELRKAPFSPSPLEVRLWGEMFEEDP